MIDVIVAGGGPVGLSAAIGAALAGLEVVVVEPRTGTIDKACGEGLMPDTLSSLRALGLDPPGVALSGIRYLSGARVAEARFIAGPGRGVRRTVLHHQLLERAVDLGVQVVPGRVAELSQSADAVEAAGLRARYLIGADGLHSTVRGAVGLQARRTGSRRYGLRRHYRMAPWSDLVEVHWAPGWEVYVTPVDQDVVGVAVLGLGPLNVDVAIASLPSLVESLADAPMASAVRGAGPFRQSTTSRVAGRVLLVGDAAGYVDALTGEGLRVGFAASRAAVDAILADRPASYEAQWRRITRSYRHVTGALLRVGASRTLRPMIVPAAQALPRTFTRIVDQIAG